MRRVLLLGLLLAGCLEYEPRGAGLPVWDDSRAPEPPPISHTDTIVQVTTPVVDVLWTIDNSGSMYDSQQALIEHYPTFMDYFDGSGLDFHIGVVSTDLIDPAHSGKLRQAAGVKFIDAETDNPIGVFTSMANVGTTGSGSERGLGATFMALEVLEDSFNDGFFRDDASIHTVVISDEEDQTPSSLITQNEFVDWYGGLKEEADDRTFSSIVSPPGPGTYSGDSYRSVTAQIGGVASDINTEDWGQVLDRLGVQAAGMKREYFLSQQPVHDSIDVRVHIEEITRTFQENEEWTYDQERNSVTFDEFVPPALSRVQITYDVLAATEGVVDGVTQGDN